MQRSEIAAFIFVIAQSLAASSLYVEGRIYLFSEDGRTTVISADERLQVFAENQLDDGFLASPSVSGRALILRTRRHLYRIERAAKLGD